MRETILNLEQKIILIRASLADFHLNGNKAPNSPPHNWALNILKTLVPKSGSSGDNIKDYTSGWVSQNRSEFKRYQETKVDPELRGMIIAWAFEAKVSQSLISSQFPENSLMIHRVEVVN